MRHGGTCVDDVNSFSCTCVDGYDETCENNINDCTATSCANGGTCVDGVNSFSCTCVDGYDGEATKTILTIVRQPRAPMVAPASMA